VVRGYEPNDLPAVVALFARSVHQIACRDYTPAQLAAWAPERPDLDAWARRLSTDGVFVSEREDRLAGFARIDEGGELDLLYVDPLFERQGVATELFHTVTAWARRSAIARLSANVSITARPFFERMGFRVLQSQIVEREGVRLENFRMERRICER
jgi:putative acetyltransferase